jgi:hypothetical protein
MRTRAMLRVLASIVTASALLVAVAPGYAEPALASGDEIAIVGPALTVHRALPEQAGLLLQRSRELERANPDDLSYSWFDEERGVVVVDATTAHGQSLAGQAVGWAAQLKASLHRRTVKHSVKALEQIRTELATSARKTMPDHDAIWLVEPDYANNRLIVTIDRHSPALLEDLAKRYGAQAVAVRVDTNKPNFQPAVGGRYNDKNPFYGGAAFYMPSGGRCTTGFAWKVSSSQYAMLTAGHCAPTGGSISSWSGAYMGNVTSGANENWVSGYGTVPFTGQSANRGDLALIKLAAYNSTHSAIYRGSSTSVGSTSLVAEMWSRSPWYGDRYCVGGTSTGETCNWNVDRLGVDFYYNVTGETIRNAYSGNNSGACIQNGDSGGSVFTVRSDGAVSAKGITSGLGNGPGPGSCTHVFSDIWDAYYGLPGVLHTW